jgi:IS5 family transposase
VKETKKQQYRIRNWPEYNAALKARGSLTLWVDEAALEGWREAQQSGRRGASRLYSESAILCALSLQMVYRLPLRATVGLLSSLFRLMGVELPVPDYSTLSRRRATLEVELGASWPAGSVHLVVDGSGFKVFGEGEWKVRQHGISKRRTWRKLHIGNNEQSGEIMAAVVTTNAWRDDEVFDLLLDQIPQEVNLEQVSGDGIYDSKGCYEILEERGVRAVFPPRRGARLADLGKKPHLAQRNANIKRIREWDEQGEDGRKKWKEETNYHRRSLVETSFFRLKTIFGNTLSARTLEAQANELFVRCAALNRMTKLGMPQSYPI